MIKVFFIIIFIGLSAKTELPKKIHQNLIQLEALRSETENNKILVYSKINMIQNNIDALTAGLSQRKLKLANRLRAAQLIKNYKWGAMFGLKNLDLLRRNLHAVRLINQSDLDFVREQIYKLDELNLEKQRLVAANQESEALSKKLNKQEQLINKQESNDNEVLKKLSQNSLLLLKGQLARPVDLKLSEPYGIVKYNSKIAEQQYIVFNKGLTFKATNTQTNIQAVGPGKVIYRDVLDHWGESIIIEHDGGYFSIYANVQNCIVQQEQQIQMSEKLCETSNTDFYFELRHMTVTVNPKKWIKDLL